jgi:hypothetical protein
MRVCILLGAMIIACAIDPALFSLPLIGRFAGAILLIALIFDVIEMFRR